MKTLADFKRLPVGTSLKLLETSKGWDGELWKDHKFYGAIRKIEHKQTNAIRFDGGSWLEYPSAKDCRIDGDTIVITSPFNKTELHYQIITN